MIKLELSEQIIAQIMEALAAQPLGRSFDAFVSIRSQLAMQRQGVQPGVPAPPPADTTVPPATPPNGALPG
jgi:hypothetical protein